MKILVLGATGRTGRYLVTEALSRGHLVKVLVRDKTNLPFDASRVLVSEGTPADKFDLTEAMHGCDVILSALNISRKSDLPWSALRTPPDFLSRSMKTIVEEAAGKGIKRVVITSAWGVADSFNDAPGWFRWFIVNSNIGSAYKDHARQEELLKTSNLDWTIVRPVGLTNSKSNKPVVVSIANTPKPTLTISRQNVARFILDALDKNLFIKQVPVISQSNNYRHNIVSSAG